MPSAKLKQLLDSENIKYISIGHSVAYTAHEIASLAHVSGRDLAKTVVVMMDGALAMVVVPASRHVSVWRVQQFTGAHSVQIASESDFRPAFPDCEIGAMPPFGNLYGIQVYADEELVGQEITFNAGTHRELIRMNYSDFYRLVKPEVGNFATWSHEAAAAIY